MIDSSGKPYIIMRIEKAANLINISKTTASKYYKELADAKLLEVKRQKFDMPNFLYPAIPEFVSQFSKNCSTKDQKLDVRKTENRKTDIEKKSFHSENDRHEFFTISQIKKNCELDIFRGDTKIFLETAIENLYDMPYFKQGSATLSNYQIRKKLSKVSADSLIYVLDNVKLNDKHISKPTNYLYSAILNSPEDYRASEIINAF